MGWGKRDSVGVHSFSVLLLLLSSSSAWAAAVPGSVWDGTDCSGLSYSDIRNMLLNAEQGAGPPPHVDSAERCGNTADPGIAAILESDPNPLYRRIAASALNRVIRHRSVVLALARTIASDPDLEVRRLATEALSLRVDFKYEDGDVISHEEAAQSITSIMMRMLETDPSPEFRKIAVHNLAYGEAQLVAPALITALKYDTDAGVRASSAFVLDKLATVSEQDEILQSAFSALLTTLRSDVASEVRERSAFALSHLATESDQELMRSAFSALLTALQSDASAQVRANSAFALGGLATAGNEELGQLVLSALLTALQSDAASEVREQSASTLSRLAADDNDEKVVKPVLSALSATLQADNSPEVRKQAAESLGYWVAENDAATATLITALSSDPEADVRTQALYSLTTTINAGLLSSLTGIAEFSDSDIAEFTESEDVDISWLKSDDPARVSSALQAIIPALGTSLASDPDRSIRRRALIASAYIAVVLQITVEDLNHQNLSAAIALLTEVLDTADTADTNEGFSENNVTSTNAELVDQMAIIRELMRTSLRKLKRAGAIRTWKSIGLFAVPLAGIAGLGWLGTQVLNRR